MKAFVVDKYKKKGALRLADVPEPTLGTTMSWFEFTPPASTSWTPRSGMESSSSILPYRPPFVLGHDVAGTVVKVGPKVRRFKVGDEVYARPRDPGRHIRRIHRGQGKPTCR